MYDRAGRPGRPGLEDRRRASDIEFLETLRTCTLAEAEAMWATYQKKGGPAWRMVALYRALLRLSGDGKEWA